MKETPVKGRTRVKDLCRSQRVQGIIGSTKTIAWLGKTLLKLREKMSPQFGKMSSYVRFLTHEEARNYLETLED